MKLYKVTTTDRYNRNWAYTVSADSEREALWKVKETRSVQDVEKFVKKLRVDSNTVYGLRIR